MVPTSHKILGTIKRGVFERKNVVSGVVSGTGSDTVDIYLGGNVTPASNISVLFTLLSSGETMSTTTDSDGKYSFDLGNLSSSWAEGDGFSVRPVMLVDENGTRFSMKYPLVVRIANDSLPYQNYSESFTYSGNNIVQIDRVIDGVTYRQTLTYNGSNQVVSKSEWVKQ